MTVYIEKPAVNLREELASLRNQGGYQEQQFYFDGLVTNGTFDSDTAWTEGTGWTISGGVASSASGLSGSLLSDYSGDLVAGKLYCVTVDVNITTGGNLFVQVANGASVNIGSVGVRTETLYLVAGSSTVYGLNFFANTTFTGTLDNISVFEADANDDVIHTMPKGWKPKDVFEDGLLQREGAAHDYTVVYDGFDYYIKPAVAPSTTTQTCVIGVRK